MKRIIISLLTLGIVGIVVTGATTAIFSDEEISTGNTFTAGAIDLTIDNESYYNGVLNDDTTWLEATDLDDHLFFSFADLKPGDWGEDTISIHVNNNDSWLCVDVTLTSDDDNGLTEPEEEDGDDSDGVGEGELADAVDFIWWADDGDNVFESDEGLLPAGPLGNLAVDETATVALADSNGNIWDETGPLVGDATHYIGKAWCFGNLTPDAVPASESPLDPTVDPGFDCDGAPVNNVTQTDSMTADIAFRAVQSRNNSGFICEPLGRSGTLTVTKIVEGGNAQVGDFSLFVDATPVTSGAPTEFLAGAHVVSESDNPDYTSVIGGANCDASGNVTVPLDGSASCTITNTFIEPEGADITVTKVVSGGPLAIGDFDLLVDAEPVESGVGEFFAPGTRTVSEVDSSGLYTATFTDGDCDSSGDITHADGVPATCELTNTYDPATTTVDKILIITTGGVAASDFTLHIVGPGVDTDISDNVPMGDLVAGEYTVTETATGPAAALTFTTVYSGACTDNAGASGTLILTQGDDLTCTVTNTEVEPE